MGSVTRGDPMRIEPPGGGPLVYGKPPREARSAEYALVGGPARMDAMRSWLVSGIHLFVVDPRRRFGDHGRAKELLSIDSREPHGASDHWHKLAAALHRHTIRGALAQLSPEERRLVTLAYLEGRTNRQIASAMGVSISTVQRRLGTALERLETYISRSGAWLSAVVLLVGSYATVRAARLGRSAASFLGTADRAQKIAATLAAGALATAALGLVGVTSDSAAPKSAPAATSPFIVPTTESAQTSASGPDAPRMVMPAQDRPDAATARGGKADVPALETTPPHTVALHPNNGCDGNPTSAPPPVPVGSKKNHPTGAPVTHPTAGGCRV
jgi:DNA-binding CsgD family transcriptional regulator